MLSDPAYLACAVIAVVVIGLAKGGLSGLGALGTPILALAIAPVEAAAILLPIIVVQDAVSVWVFRHCWNRRIVAITIPFAAIGIALGWLFAAQLPAVAIKGILGAISLLFGLWRLWLERGGRTTAPWNMPDWIGALLCIATGFTSQIAHAGGPPFQMWVGPKKLPHLEFVGTTAIAFAAMNWMKVPAYWALGEFTSDNLMASAMLMPVAVVSTFAGVWLVRRMHGKAFYLIVYALMVLLGLKLLYDALT